MQFLKQFTGNEVIAWANVGLQPSDPARVCFESGAGDKLVVKTSYGTQIAVDGDWIARGVDDEFYPIPGAVFAATYVPAQSPEEIAAAERRREIDSLQLAAYRNLVEFMQRLEIAAATGESANKSAALDELNCLVAHASDAVDRC